MLRFCTLQVLVGLAAEAEIILDEPSSRDEGLEGTWWDWLLQLSQCKAMLHFVVSGCLRAGVGQRFGIWAN